MPAFIGGQDQLCELFDHRSGPAKKIARHILFVLSRVEIEPSDSGFQGGPQREARARAILGAVDLVACEDTRTTGVLLSRLGISRELVSYHEHNEIEAAERLAEAVASGRSVALATDALNRADQLSPTNATQVAVNRAILLFQTGQKTEGLARARQALVSAKTPADKDLAQANLHAMETRLAAAKTNPTNAPGQP